MGISSTSFTPGHPKVGGMKKGYKRRTDEMVNRIFDIVEQDFYDEESGESRFADDLAKMSPKDRRDVFLKLLKTVMPTMASVSIEDNKTVSSIRQLMDNMAAYKKQN